MTTETVNIEAEKSTPKREGAERRRQKRFECQGHAEVIVAEAEFLFRGEIRDLSLSGCFVATRARLRIGPGMQVLLGFMVAGQKVKCEAVVRSLRAGKGAGFEFLASDEPTRKALTRLIAQLKTDAETAANMAENAAKRGIDAPAEKIAKIPAGLPG